MSLLQDALNRCPCDPSADVPNPNCPQHGRKMEPLDPLVRINQAFDHTIAGMSKTLNETKELFDALEDVSKRCLKLAEFLKDNHQKQQIVKNAQR